MRKYTKPEMVCKIFERENIMTASGGSETYESSASKLKNQLTQNENISSDNIVDVLWQ